MTCHTSLTKNQTLNLNEDRQWLYSLMWIQLPYIYSHDNLCRIMHLKIHLFLCKWMSCINLIDVQLWFHILWLQINKKVFTKNVNWVRVMVFNIIFNNISVISRWSVLLVESTHRKPLTCCMTLTNIIT
jgi:hypothetical protein